MKIGVIGTGSMGKNHVRVLKNISEISEIAITDLNRENLDSTVKRFAVKGAYTDYMEMIEKEKPEGIIIATKPETHTEIALDVIGTGLPLLIEKPIAPTVEEGRKIIDKAAEKNVFLTIGHTERFNPVVAKIKSFIDEGNLNNIYLINTHRIGPFPKRLLGNMEGVLIDLAVHDLDILNYLCGEIIDLKSQVIKIKNQEIYVRTLMEMVNGVKASSEFSWIAPKRLRTIEIYGDSGMISADYYNQEFWFYENSDFDYITNMTDSFLGTGLINVGKVIKYPLFKQEPLELELRNFIGSISGETEILVKPEEALLALKYALQIS